MDTKALVIKDISIKKIPGFNNGMQKIGPLSQHINIIVGPNASGKSSTARTIQDIIWKENIGSIIVDANVSIGERDWNIEIDNGFYRCQNEGQDDSLPSIPAYDESKRYFLALHELIKEDDKNLAQEILRETIGGYNLEQAKKSLEYDYKKTPRSIGEYTRYYNNSQKVDNIKREQENLSDKRAELSGLDKEYEKAKQDRDYKDLYSKILRYKLEEEKKRDLEEKLKDFPKRMKKIKGDEYKNVENYNVNIKKAEQEILTNAKEFEDKKEELSNLNIPVGGYDSIEIDKALNFIDRLGSLEKDIENREKDIASLQEERNISLNGLFSSLKEDALKELEIGDINKLDKFFEDANRVIGNEKRIKDRLKELEDRKKTAGLNKERISSGIEHLVNWLDNNEKEESKTSKKPQWILFALGLITTIAGALFGLIGLVGLVFMLVFIYFYNEKPIRNSIRETRISDFRQTGLKEPETWEANNVSKRLRELYQELDIARQEERLDNLIEEERNKLEELGPEKEEIERIRIEWEEKLCSIPELEKENIESYSSLFWFLKNLEKWQKINNKTKSEIATLKKDRESYIDILTSINSIFSSISDKTAEDTYSAKAIYKNIIDRKTNSDGLNKEIKHLERRLGELRNSKKGFEEEIKCIYDNLDLEIGNGSKIEELINRKPEYEKVKKEQLNTLAILGSIRNELEKHRLYNSIEDELEGIGINEVEKKKEEYGISSQMVEEIYKKIVEINTQIDKTKSGQELEEALNEETVSLDKLEEHYLDTLSLNTGDIIINSLKKKTMEHSNSKVLNRANQIFNKITKGHYELILDDSQGGNFKAKDTSLNQGLPIEHLSSGTRIQLLIAVRLAFIESQEGNLKLPILADEVLANSDDLRAKQIIEALIEISKEGRQVFYFTAQSDELVKWEEELEGSGLKSKIITLLGKENQDIDYRKEEKTTTPSLYYNTPTPGDWTYEEYLKEINPPKYNLLKDNIEKIHLSYLMEDNDHLYLCLTQGIKTYGHLNSYLEINGRIEGLDKEGLGLIYAKAELLDYYQEIYKQGRPKSIDREVLKNSKAVSDRFIDNVGSKLAELGNNPKDLIESLRNREVSGFRENSIDNLENYLFENNYLSDEEPMKEDDINRRITAKLSNMELSKIKLSNKEAEKFLEMILV